MSNGAAARTLVWNLFQERMIRWSWTVDPLLCVDRSSTLLTFRVNGCWSFLVCSSRVLLLWRIGIDNCNILMFIPLGIGIHSMRVWFWCNLTRLTIIFYCTLRRLLDLSIRLGSAKHVAKESNWGSFIFSLRRRRSLFLCQQIRRRSIRPFY